LDRLWNACSGPLRHICDCDKDIPEHPSSILSIPPGGEYSDTRSYLFRLWCIVRFQICDWLSGSHCLTQASNSLNSHT
jgi:hypothetical protein